MPCHASPCPAVPRRGLAGLGKAWLGLGDRATNHRHFHAISADIPQQKIDVILGADSGGSFTVSKCVHEHGPQESSGDHVDARCAIRHVPQMFLRFIETPAPEPVRTFGQRKILGDVQSLFSPQLPPIRRGIRISQMVMYELPLPIQRSICTMHFRWESPHTMKAPLIPPGHPAKPPVCLNQGLAEKQLRVQI